MDVEYYETDDDRVLELREDGDCVTVSVTKRGYGMLVVADDSGEVERYYGFDMALDHAAELLSVSPHGIEVPDEAEDMGM